MFISLFAGRKLLSLLSSSSLFSKRGCKGKRWGAKGSFFLMMVLQADMTTESGCLTMSRRNSSNEGGGALLVVVWNQQ